MNWRPIETAPKDGREVDLWVDSQRITDAYWLKSWLGEGWHHVTRKGVALLDAYDGQPTHWMPLPQPPQD